MSTASTKVQLPTNEEIEAMAMLLGESTAFCSCCLGKRVSKGLFGIPVRCSQCNGFGYDYLGVKTLKALGLKMDWTKIRVRRAF